MNTGPPTLHWDVAAMGTPCTLCLQGDAPAGLEAVAQTLVQELQRLEAKYSRYRPDSLMSQINRVAAEGGPTGCGRRNARPAQLRPHLL